MDQFWLKKHRNLGQLTQLRILHDNAGMGPGGVWDNGQARVQGDGQASVQGRDTLNSGRGHTHKACGAQGKSLGAM